MQQTRKNNVVVIGEWNAVLGEGTDDAEIRNFCLGTRFERGKKLAEISRRKICL